MVKNVGAIIGGEMIEHLDPSLSLWSFTMSQSLWLSTQK